MISVITPVHAKSGPFIDETYQSLLRQSFSAWEWVLVLNGGGTAPDYITKDGRVKVFWIDDDDPTGPLSRGPVGRQARLPFLAMHREQYPRMARRWSIGVKRCARHTFSWSLSSPGSMNSMILPHSRHSRWSWCSWP